MEARQVVNSEKKEFSGQKGRADNSVIVRFRTSSVRQRNGLHFSCCQLRCSIRLVKHWPKLHESHTQQEIVTGEYV